MKVILNNYACLKKFLSWQKKNKLLQTASYFLLKFLYEIKFK